MACAFAPRTTPLDQSTPDRTPTSTSSDEDAATEPQPQENGRLGPQLFVRVAEAFHTDVSAGVARLDPQAVRALSLQPGAYVNVQGKRTTTVRLAPSPNGEEVERAIRLDGAQRDNAQVGLDDRVRVSPCQPESAESVQLAPPDLTSYNEADLAAIRLHLSGFALRAGDKVRVTNLARGERDFRVVATEPPGPVVLGEATVFRLQSAVLQRSRGFEVRYEDIGGLQEELLRVRELVELPMKYPALFARLRIEPPKGVLLYGPPGTGKTLIARAVASEVEAHFVHLNGPEIITKYYGESEARLREIFEDAQRKAPSIIFLDELDAIAPKRADVAGEVEKRVVAQLLALMDGLVGRGEVVVIGATNLPEMVDPALRRPGRFDREISVRVPSSPGRLEILRIHTRGMPLAEDVDVELLAQVTHGFVGADLEVLVKEAGMLALHEVLDAAGFDVEDPTRLGDHAQIHMRHFLAALKGIEPTALREFFVEKPNVRWDQVGGLREAREFLRSAIEYPRRRPEVFRELGLRPPRGILLDGPTGTGKTLIAKAVAAESGLSFMTADAATIFSKWMGEAEKTLRTVFRKAKQAAPCLLFFDELEALAPIRGSGQISGGADRLVSQFLNELDNLDELSDVVVLGATNRTDLLDPAVLSPGRFAYVLRLPMPDQEDRLEILTIHTRDMPLSDEVDLAELARLTERFSGSDLAALCHRAALLEVQHLVQLSEEQLPERLSIGPDRFHEARLEVEKRIGHRSEA